MTDKELLEAAAKAFWGKEIDDVCLIRWSENDNSIVYMHGENQDHNGCDVELCWNPLEDDGDALRLSCKLLMQIIQDGVGFVKVGWHVGVEIGTPTADGRGPWYWKEWLHVANGDRGIATRRAITRAAAEIGRAMP